MRGNSGVWNSCTSIRCQAQVSRSALLELRKRAGASLDRPASVSPMSKMPVPALRAAVGDDASVRIASAPVAVHLVGIRHRLRIVDEASLVAALSLARD